jgi:hypothetical protein
MLTTSTWLQVKRSVLSIATLLVLFVDAYRGVCADIDYRKLRRQIWL